MSTSKAHTIGSWLLATRVHYLDFLRNLSPQVVLASLAWVIAVKLDFGKLDPSNWLQTAGFFIYLAAFAWSFWANATLFLERAFPEFSAWRKAEEGVLTEAGIRGWKFLAVFFTKVMRQRPVEGIMSIAMLVLLTFALAAVLVSSIAATVSFLRATGKA